jgi:hypothetical protein
MSRIPERAALAAAFCTLVFIWVVPAAVAGVPRGNAVHARSPVGIAHDNSAQPLSAQSPFAYSTRSRLDVGHAHIDPAIPSQSGMRAPRATTLDPSAGGNLSYGNGDVQHNPTFYAIFWLQPGQHYEPGLAGGDFGNSVIPGYSGLMSRYLQDSGSTGIANVVSQYYDTKRGFAKSVGTSTSFGGSWIDTNSSTHDGSTGNPVLDSDIQQAVNDALAANPSWNDGTNSTFYVFTGYGIESCMDSSEGSCTSGIPSSLGYCAYHGSFSDSRGHTAVYANMPEDYYWDLKAILNGGEGCLETNALPEGDVYADPEFSTLSHEQFEAETDPGVGGWRDSAGNEIGDKCNGLLGTEPYFGPSNATANNHDYVLQQEWSNADGACSQDLNAPGGGFNLGYGPYSAQAGSSFSINIAQSDGVVNDGCCSTPLPSIDWGDGTSSEPGGDGGACLPCNLTGSHTYAFDPTASYPKTYTATLSYYTGIDFGTGCCSAQHTYSFHIVVFQPPILTVTVNASGRYGTAPNMSGLSPGNSAIGYSPGAQAANVTGTLTCSTTAIASSPAGSYPISNCSGLSDPGFDIVYDYAGSSYTVTQAPLTVTANNQSRPYGSANPSLTATLSGFVLGQNLATSGVTGAAACSTTATASSAVGTYMITCSQGTLSSTNYSFNPFVAGTLTITKVALTVTADNQSRPYASANPPLTATLSGFVLGQNLATSGVSGTASCSTTATTSSPGGTYPITCTQGTLASANYSFGPFVAGTLTVTKVALTVTADNQSRPYGSANPPLTATLTGFVAGETLANSDVTGAAVCTTTATSSSSSGSYPITCTQGNLSSADYDFGPFVAGTLTVTKVALTVTANDKSRQFGAANPPLTATLSGFVLGQSLATSDVTGTASCTTTATTYSPGGGYPITCTQGTLSSADYSFAPFVPGTLTVTYSAACISGTTTKVTVAPGQSICIAAGAQITGPVTVAAGGSLDLEGATINGPIMATGGAVVRICGTTTSGSLMVTGNTGLVLVGGDAATGACARNTLGGAVSITGNSGGVEFDGNTVTGSLTITGNTGTLPSPDSGSVHAVGNTVSGKSKIQS